MTSADTVWLSALPAVAVLAVIAWAVCTTRRNAGLLLLRVSGVTLLDRDIGERRPAHQDYVARTSALVPWRPRSA
jgi:steroid 5-alpha reductase family enzyme